MVESVTISSYKLNYKAYSELNSEMAEPMETLTVYKKLSPARYREPPLNRLEQAQVF